MFDGSKKAEFQPRDSFFVMPDVGVNAYPHGIEKNKPDCIA
jgi:hypothetical protein